MPSTRRQKIANFDLYINFFDTRDAEKTPLQLPISGAIGIDLARIGDGMINPIDESIKIIDLVMG
jgi:hypothetical protein